MPEPESLQTAFQQSFLKTGQDQYALRVAAPSGSPSAPIPTDPYPLKQNSLFDSRAVFEPGPGAILALLSAAELTDGYYKFNATWGNLKIAGGGEPTFADISNFGFYANNFLVDDLVALNGVAANIDGFFNFGGFDISIRTKIAGTANVAYMGALFVTKIATPGVIIPPP